MAEHESTREELISDALESMGRLTGNGSRNLWDFLNGDEAFIRAFLSVHAPAKPQPTGLKGAIWDVLEDELEGNLKLDLNRYEDNLAFSELVNRLEKAVRDQLGL